MVKNVYRYNLNSHKIELFDIFHYTTFVHYIKEARQKNWKDKEAFAAKTLSELRYYFWSKAEHELILQTTEDGRVYLMPWCGSKNPEEEKIDVTDDTLLDWVAFADKMMNQKGYKNEAKIDIYDQVMENFSEFIDYCWENL